MANPFPQLRDVSYTQDFPKSITVHATHLFLSAEGGSVAGCCAKQEHLIAMIKIKHFNRTQVVCKEFSCFPEPAVLFFFLIFLLRCGTWPLEQIGSSPVGVGPG